MSLYSTGLKAMLRVLAIALGMLALAVSPAIAQENKPNVVMLMTDDIGWNDFGAYGGGANFGHPTPNIDRIAPGREANPLPLMDIHKLVRTIGAAD